ncbi:MAG: Hpt domain-containing protein [Desulfobacteraceae bacterium]|nr:Hpt domain-containing protein [Desulfobacteraceae bacterium]MBC2720204.1 Hpt domain-containing protein [Desulfobacteraceae bacterium]
MNDKIKPVFDRKHAMGITDGDTKFLKELMEMFNDDYPEKLDDISKAIKEKNFNALDKTAHSLKGSSGNLGLTGVYELSWKLEKLGKAKDIEDTNKTLDELKEELERFSKFISKPGWEEE